MVIFVLTLLAGVTSSEPTGVVFGLSSECVNDAKTAFLTYLISEIKDTVLLNSTSFVGTTGLSYNLTLSEVILHSLEGNIEETRVDFTSSNKLTFYMSDFSGDMSLSLDLTSSLVNDTGSASIGLQGLSLASELTLKELNGHPLMEVKSLSIEIEDLTFELEGSKASKIVNQIYRILKDKIKDYLGAQISAMFIKTLNASFKQLLELPLVSPVTDKIDVNYTLSGPIVMTDEFLEIYSVGEFFVHETQDRLPNPEPKLLPDFNETAEGVQMAISEHFINSAFYAAYRTDAFIASITAESVPDSIPLDLNTDFLDTLLPGIVETFGSNQPCDMNCAATESAPAIDIIAPYTEDPNGEISGVFTVLCDIIVRDQGTAVGIKTKMVFEAEAYVEEGDIKGKLIEVKVEQVVETLNNIGKPVPTDAIKSTLNDLIALTLPSMSTFIFGNGIDLPDYQMVSWTDSRVTLGDGYLLAASNPIYNFD